MHVNMVCACVARCDGHFNVSTRHLQRIAACMATRFSSKSFDRDVGGSAEGGAASWFGPAPEPQGQRSSLTMRVPSGNAYDRGAVWCGAAFSEPVEKRHKNRPVISESESSARNFTYNKSSCIL